MEKKELIIIGGGPAGLAAAAAAKENGIDDIEIYHDYEGVGKWADGLWKANNPLTQGYKQFIADARRVMSIRFIKVKAHAGNKYNEMADKLAKQALDL